MRRRMWRGVLLALALAALLAAPALAKSPPDKLVLEGPGLATALAITDPAALVGFSPWDRGFIAWARGPITTPPTEQPYTVSFFLGGRKIYVVHYVPGPAGRPGAIYIPGPGDSDYQLNIGTIMGASSDRWGPEGKWQYATANWDTVLQRALRVHGAPSPAPGGLLPRAPLWGVAVTASGLLGSAAWRGWRRHRAGYRQPA